MPKCVVCGRELKKKVGRTVYGHTAHLAYFGSQLEAQMYASTMKKLPQETAKVVSSTWSDKVWYIKVSRDGGGWQGLGKVCGSKDLACLKKFVRSAVWKTK